LLRQSLDSRLLRECRLVFFSPMPFICFVDEDEDDEGEL
jgi:hypothetical protein